VKPIIVGGARLRAADNLPQPGEPTMDLLHPEVRGLDEGIAWVWNQRQRAFILPRSVRLPKRPRRLARQKLREDA
jgi:hypothetical protein